MSVRPHWVAGATGFVGGAVVAELRRQGLPVIAHVRPDSATGDAAQARFHALGAVVDRSPWQPTVLAAAMRAAAVGVVYGLYGTTRASAKREAIGGDIYRAVDLGLTVKLVDAARSVEPPPRVVYLSSIGADANSRAAYLRARGEAEAAVVASGLPYRIARPATITGEARAEFRLGERMAGWLGDPLLAVAGVLGAGKARARYRSTTADILARALVRLALEAGPDRVVDGDDLRDP